MTALILSCGVKLAAPDLHLLASIMLVESTGIYRYNYNRNGSADLGLAQINTVTAARYRLDTYRLISDDCYSIQSAALILQDLKRKHARLPNWECIWHTGRAGYDKYDTRCLEYKNKLEKAKVSAQLGR